MAGGTAYDILRTSWVSSKIFFFFENVTVAYYYCFNSPITELELEVPDIDPNAGRKVVTTTTTVKPFSDSSFVGNKYLPPSNSYLPPSNEYLPPSSNDIRNLQAPL